MTTLCSALYVTLKVLNNCFPVFDRYFLFLASTWFAFGIVSNKFTLEQAKKAQRGSRDIAFLFLQPWRWMACVSTPSPGRFIPGKTTEYPLYIRLGWPQGRSEWVRKISPLLGFDLRTVQPVTSRYTDYTIPSHKIYVLENCTYEVKRPESDTGCIFN
jgi:hypothetical protein